MILIQHMDSIPFHPLRDPNRGGGGGGGGVFVVGSILKCLIWGLKWLLYAHQN